MLYNLIMASGKGTRLYPLSTPEKPKQFLKLYNHKTLIQNTIERFEPFGCKTCIITRLAYRRHIAFKYADVLFEDDPDETADSMHTFLSGVPDDAIVIQTPSDHYIEYNQAFEDAIQKAIDLVDQYNIIAIGKQPDSIRADLGYIKTGKPLVEKPGKELGASLIHDGFIYNTAIYVYRAGNMIRYFNKYYTGGESFEVDILNRIDGLKVLNVPMVWEDVGTFDSLQNVLRRGEQDGETKEVEQEKWHDDR